MSHTVASLLGVAVVVVLDWWVLRTRLLGRKAFWVSYTIVLFFQLLTNEWLTSRGVFDYGEGAVIGWRIGSAPIEDFVFGFALVTGSMVAWVWWGRRGVQRRTPVGPAPVVQRLAQRLAHRRQDRVRRSARHRPH